MTMRSSCNIHAGARRIARPQGGRRAPAVGRVHPAGRRQNAGRRPRHPRRACPVHERMELSQSEGDISELLGMVRKMLG